MFPPNVIKLNTLFTDRGYQIRVVGGWVRDTLRGIAPKDLDLCTTALPEQVIALCDECGLSYVAAGLKHGTVGIIVDGTIYEVTTLRVDAETDGRHARVEFTADWRSDAARRDFTINAMSMDLDGRLYDYFNGRKHLEARRVVFVGNPADRIQEDYLRVLRYYRFKGLLGDNLDEVAVEKAIEQHAVGLEKISVERIWSEMSRVLVGDNLKNVLLSMYVTDTIGHIGLEGVLPRHIESATKTRALTNNPVTVLAALTTNPLAERWKLKNEDASLLRWLQHDRDSSDYAQMRELKVIATTRGLGRRYAIERAAMYGVRFIWDDIQKWTVPEFPVSGADLRSLGFPQGAEIGVVLARLRHRWQLTNYTLNRDALLKGITVNSS